MSSYQSYDELMRSAQQAAMSMFTNASDEELKVRFFVRILSQKQRFRQ